MKYTIIGDNNYLGDLQEEFFKNRGIENISDFKNINSYTPTSFKKFKNMKKAVDLFKAHIDKDSTIAILVDEDVDGITSASIVYNFIKANYPKIKLNYIIQQQNKAHGLQLNDDGVSNIDKECDLLIIPDAGSDNFKGHKLLKSKGIDVLVIDHHDCKGYSENALVVNNKMSNVSVNLTGSAMAYKFIEAVNHVLKLNYNIEQYLDLVAFGLIGDSADSRDLDVQYYIQRGLKYTNSFMLEALLDGNSYSTKGIVNQNSLGWYIAPCVNAVVRLGTKDERDILFRAFINKDTDKVFPYTASRGKNKGITIDENIYEHCTRMAISLRGKQQRTVKNIINGTKKIEGLVDKIGETDKKIIVCDVTEQIGEDEGLTGLLANKLLSYYKRPVLCLRQTADGKLGGSGRARGVLDFQDRLNATGIIKGAGHQQAFGIMKTDKELDFIDENVNEKLKDLDITPSHIIDFKIPHDELEDYMIEDLFELKDYFGKGLEEPLIYIENFTIDTSDIGVNDKVTTMFFSSNYIKYVKFNINSDFYEKMVDWEDKMCYNIIGRPSMVEYEGEIHPQIVIEDIEKVEITEDSDSDWEDFDEEDYEW